MAARRLLLFAAVLLMIGLLAAAVAPREEDAPVTTSTGTQPAQPPAKTITRTIPADSEPDTQIKLETGTLLRLAVEASEPGTVTIDGLDRIEPVDASTPARFEVFMSRPGSFPVRVQAAGQAESEAGRVVARLEVKEPA